MSMSLSQFAAQRLRALEAKRQRRALMPTARTDGVRMVRDGRALISFCCNDYLGLATDARVKAAAAEAVERHGTGAGASRLVTGDHPLLRELESALAVFKGKDDALVFGSGYLTNLGVIPALVCEGDLILVDELSHACILGGAKLSGARELRFRHNDMNHLRQLLATERGTYRHALIVTDGVFSMDGDLAPLPELRGLADTFDAWLMVDDAHGLGTVGGGRGASQAFNPPVTADVQMGTLSKSLGSYGGYVAAAVPVCDLLRSRARTLVYSTGLPPASAAAALASLEVLTAEPVRVARPLTLAQDFCASVGLPAPDSPIVPMVFGEEQAALNASALLEDAGFLVTAIRPPTVPARTARLRFTFTAAHTDEDVTRLIEAVRTLTVPAAAE